MFIEEGVTNMENQTLETLSELAYKQRALEEKKAILEKETKELEFQIQNISRKDIPGILNELNLTSIELKTGEKIIVKDQLKASIVSGNKEKAFLDMIQAEIDSVDMSKELATMLVAEMFSTNLTINVNTEEEKEEIANKLIGLGVPFNYDRNIHWQTLRKWCKERRDAGELIPESINVFEYQETVLK